MSKKGSQFERDIAKKLSLWWTDGIRDDVFWRTSQSGGRATTRAKKGKSTANSEGDLCAIDPIGQPLMDRFVIELKKGYNRDSLMDLVDSPTDKLVGVYPKWIKKVKEQAEKHRKQWLLIVKKDRRREIAIFDLSTSYHLNMYKHFFKVMHDIYFYPLDYFIEDVTPVDIKEKIKCP